jgi:hypothetical protein
MDTKEVLFTSSRFNLSKVGDHFINPCCFGEDLVTWLRIKLAENKIETATPYQEDWGWELPVTCGRGSYYLCVSGNADKSGNDEGEWRIIVEKRRSVWERLAKKGNLAGDDPMLKALEQLLSNEPTISNVTRQE